MVRKQRKKPYHPYKRNEYKRIVNEWEEKNPGKKKIDCVRDTGVSIITVSKYWEGNTWRRKKKEPCTKAIREWREKNPRGTKRRCADEIGYAMTTVFRYWGDGETKEEKVRKWREKNPRGTKAQCARELFGVSISSVHKYWKK